MTAFLIFLIGTVATLWLVNKRQLTYKIESLSKDFESKKKELEAQILQFQQKNEALSVYQNILNANEEAKRILTNAQAEAEQLKTQITVELQQASLSAKDITKQAEADAANIRETAKAIMENAETEAGIIKERAHKEAEEIAGEAYNALKNMKEITKTAEAMQNIINGYGEKYLVPTYSLLDQLADELSYTEAGVRLKQARNKTISMLQRQVAASCDYVESYRRKTAISFVLDAFNGKVDSILSQIKKDNFGTLEQKIKDAYNLVNYNGKAFRNAAISQEYFLARLDELRWGVIAQEIKWKEQEEQRLIKEQIREEEKARREYEKAIRDAQKEEDLLKKLIEKAQKEILAATEEQKAKYEERLRELETKLQDAEERNRRAVSMAQQTKSGNVYIISNIGSFGEHVYKIGMTRRLEPLDRIRELGDASVPFEFDVHSLIYSDNAPGLERELHKKFLRLQMNKVNPRKEFFRVSLNDIKEKIEEMGITAKWTMVAEAKQYRESLAIEEQIMGDKEKQLEWEKYQLQIDPVMIDIEEEVAI